MSFGCSIPLLGLILTASEKWALFWRFCRTVDILLRYLCFCNVFLIFQLFWMVSQWSSSKWPTMVNFAKKSGLNWLLMTNFGHFAGLPQNEAQIHPEWPISHYSPLFPSFATKVSHFSRNLKFSFVKVWNWWCLVLRLCWLAVKTTKTLSAFLKLVYFFFLVDG